jgi:hypothetical protein
MSKPNSNEALEIEMIIYFGGNWCSCWWIQLGFKYKEITYRLEFNEKQQHFI